MPIRYPNAKYSVGRNSWRSPTVGGPRDSGLGQPGGDLNFRRSGAPVAPAALEISERGFRPLQMEILPPASSGELMTWQQAARASHQRRDMAFARALQIARRLGRFNPLLTLADVLADSLLDQPDAVPVSVTPSPQSLGWTQCGICPSRQSSVIRYSSGLSCTGPYANYANSCTGVSSPFGYENPAQVNSALVNLVGFYYRGGAIPYQVTELWAKNYGTIAAKSANVYWPYRPYSVMMPAPAPVAALPASLPVGAQQPAARTYPLHRMARPPQRDLHLWSSAAQRPLPSQGTVRRTEVVFDTKTGSVRLIPTSTKVRFRDFNPRDKKAKLEGDPGSVAWAYKWLRRGAAAYEAGSELKDFVECLWEALPKDKRGKADDLPSMLRDLAKNWEYMDIGEAVKNLAYNNLEDKIVGKGIAASNYAAKQLGFGSGSKIYNQAFGSLGRTF